MPVEESDVNIINNISRKLPHQIDTVKRLRDNIFETLKTEYPCSNSDLKLTRK